MTLRSALLLLLVAALPALGLDSKEPSNRADNGRHVRRETYDVDGLSAGEIRHELDRHGPLAAGKRFDARTEWNVHWRFDLDRRAARCSATHLQVDVDVVVTLPHWRRPQNATPELIERWERYMRALERHEDGHREIGFSAADEIQAALANPPAASTCAAAELHANRIGHDIVDRQNRRDAEYDRETNHGATQGARFP